MYVGLTDEQEALRSERDGAQGIAVNAFTPQAAIATRKLGWQPDDLPVAIAFASPGWARRPGIDSF